MMSWWGDRKGSALPERVKREREVANAIANDKGTVGLGITRDLLIKRENEKAKGHKKLNEDIENMLKAVMSHAELDTAQLIRILKASLKANDELLKKLENEIRWIKHIH